MSTHPKRHPSLTAIHFHNRWAASKIVPSPTWVLVRVLDDSAAPVANEWGLVHEFCGGHAAAGEVERLVQFLKELPDWVEELHIHCSLGASRSPAIALWASEWFSVPLTQRAPLMSVPLYELMVAIGREPTK